MSSTIFTDPCPGTRKYLEIHYLCTSDSRRTPFPPAHLNNGTDLASQPPFPRNDLWLQKTHKEKDIKLQVFAAAGVAGGTPLSNGSEAAVSDGRDLMQSVWKFAYELLQFRRMSSMHYSHSIPGQFALLVSSNDAHVTEGRRLHGKPSAVARPELSR